MKIIKPIINSKEWMKEELKERTCHMKHEHPKTIDSCGVGHGSDTYQIHYVTCPKIKSRKSHYGNVKSM